jgi:transposase
VAARALLLHAFFSIRSDRPPVGRIVVDLLFRWFVGLGVDDPVWDATTFTQNRDPLPEPIGNILPAEAEERSYAMLDEQRLAAYPKTKQPR